MKVFNIQFSPLTLAIWYGCGNRVAPGCCATTFCVAAPKFSTQCTFFPQCPQYETCFRSPFWHLESRDGSFWQILDPCHTVSNGHFHKLRLGRDAEWSSSDCLISGIIQSDGWSPASYLNPHLRKTNHCYHPPNCGLFPHLR